MGKSLKGKDLGKGISQRLDGKYQARFTDRFGKRISYTDNDIHMVKEWMATEQAKNKLDMNVVDRSTTLNEWFAKWMEVYKYGIIAPNTERQYKQVYMKHIASVLGKNKLHEITQLKIKALINELDKAGYKYETKNKVRIILLDMFNRAMQDNLVMKNPARGIRVVRDEKKEPKFLTPEEQKAFFDYCKGTFYDNMFVVSVNSGLRPGEVYALTEADLDFEEKTISVSKTLLYQKLEGDTQKTFHIGPPKTKSSVRKVKMTRACETALKKQILQSRLIKSRTPKKLDEQFKDLLFTTKFGTPINAEIECEAIKVIIDGINLIRDNVDCMEYFGGHCFRHTFASNCYRNGCSWKVIQRLLGHATLSMTMDLYVHLFEEEMDESIDKLSEAMDKLDAMDMAEEVDNGYNDYVQREKEQRERIIQFVG